MHTLTFGSRYSEEDRIFIGNFNSIKDANKSVFEMIEKLKFKSYYQISNYYDDQEMIEIDFGNHSQFFYISNVTKELWDKKIKNEEV